MQALTPSQATTVQPALVAPEAKTKDKGVFIPLILTSHAFDHSVLNVKMAGNRIKMIIIIMS